MEAQMNLLMSLNDTTKCLGIGKTKTYQLIREGELQLVKIGAKSLVTRDSILAYVAKISGVSDADL
jgi:excisionase family DNA binding protein